MVAVERPQRRRSSSALSTSSKRSAATAKSAATTTTTANAMMEESFNMSIDLTAALSDEHLGDDISAMRGIVRRPQPGGGRRIGGRPSFLLRPSNRFSNRLGSIGEHIDRLGDDDGGGGRRGHGRNLSIDDSILNLGSSSGAFDGRGGDDTRGDVRRSGLSAASRRNLLPPSRRPLMTWQRSGTIGRLVSSTASTLAQLEDFLHRDDSQSDLLAGGEDDSTDDSIRSELRRLGDFEEEMRREMEGLWLSGAVGGWRDDGGDDDDGEGSMSEMQMELWEADRLLAASEPPAETESSSAPRGDDAPTENAPPPSPSEEEPDALETAAAIAGGLSLARRRSSSALDLAGLEDFEARLEAEWEDALLASSSDLGLKIENQQMAPSSPLGDNADSEKKQYPSVIKKTRKSPASVTDMPPLEIYADDGGGGFDLGLDLERTSLAEEEEEPRGALEPLPPASAAARNRPEWTRLPTVQSVGSDYSEDGDDHRSGRGGGRDSRSSSIASSRDNRSSSVAEGFAVMESPGQSSRSLGSVAEAAAAVAADAAAATSVTATMADEATPGGDDNGCGGKDDVVGTSSLSRLVGSAEEKDGGAEDGGEKDVFHDAMAEEDRGDDRDGAARGRAAFETPLPASTAWPVATVDDVLLPSLSATECSLHCGLSASSSSRSVASSSPVVAAKSRRARGGGVVDALRAAERAAGTLYGRTMTTTTTTTTTGRAASRIVDRRDAAALHLALTAALLRGRELGLVPPLSVPPLRLPASLLPFRSGTTPTTPALEDQLLWPAAVLLGPAAATVLVEGTLMLTGGAVEGVRVAAVVALSGWIAERLFAAGGA